MTNTNNGLLTNSIRRRFWKISNMYWSWLWKKYNKKKRFLTFSILCYNNKQKYTSIHPRIVSEYFRNILCLSCMHFWVIGWVSVSMPPSGHTYSGSSGYDRIKSEYGSRWILYEIAPVFGCRLSSSTPPGISASENVLREGTLWITNFHGKGL